MRSPGGRPRTAVLRLPLFGVVRHELFGSELPALEGLSLALALTPDLCFG